MASNLPAKFITVHCSASPPDVFVDSKVITRWHRARGWLTIGYHFVILRSGVVEKGRELDKIGAHVEGHNTGNIGICLVGGVDKLGKPAMNYTPDQLNSLALLLINLKTSYPDAEVLGHCDWEGVNKACPSFDVRKWIKDTGVFI